MRRIFVFAALIFSLVATSAGAVDVPLLPPPLPSEDAARLMAKEMAVRMPRGYVHGQFVPTTPRAAPVKSMAKADASPCGQTASTTPPAVAPAVENGMRFFPIQRGASPREFRLAGRGLESTAAAQPTPATPAKTSVATLAEAAVQPSLQTAPPVDGHAVEMTEDDMIIDPADPTAAAKQAVLSEIRRFRASRGLE
jgi:hypothetical protein